MINIKGWATAKWSSIDEGRRLWITIFTQVWTWPQVISFDLPMRIGFPLMLTCIACVMYNIIKLINHYDV